MDFILFFSDISISFTNQGVFLLGIPAFNALPKGYRVFTKPRSPGGIVCQNPRPNAEKANCLGGSLPIWAPQWPLQLT